MAEEHSAVQPFARSAEARQRMVATQIEARGIRAPSVLAALRTIPRELFVPAERSTQAYDDCALPIGPGQTISQPYIVAYMTEHLTVTPACRVLEIGTGTGYQAAILACLAAEVHTVERDADLSAAAAARLRSLTIANVHCHVGDGSAGWPAAAPYDRILVTAGCPEVPAPLLAQLSPGGVLVLPVGASDTQTLLRIQKRDSGTAESWLIPCRFVKLVGAHGWPA